MRKLLYLKEDYLDLISKGKEQTGEQLGGKYVARVQTGIEKDGSPQYRYFTSTKDYEEYLAKQRKGKMEGTKSKKKKKDKSDSSDSDLKEKLQTKLKKEQKKSGKQAKDPGTKKVSGARSKNRSLFAGSTRDFKKYGVNKSERLYLGVK